MFIQIPFLYTQNKQLWLLCIYCYLLTTGCGYDGGIIHVDLKDIEQPTDSILYTHQDKKDSDSDSASVSTIFMEADYSSDSHHNTQNDSDSNKKIDTDSSINTEDDPIIPQPDYTDYITDDMWTFFSIADIQNGPSTGTNHIHSMATLDANAIALFEVGDMTHYALLEEWQNHQQALEDGATDAGLPANHFRTTESQWGDYTRVIGVPGNHDVWSADWYSLWNTFLPGQRELDVNSEQGIYFSLSYENTLFIILDSNNVSDAQTKWLATVLASQAAKNAKWKIALFHEPVYPCGGKQPKTEALQWTTLFESFKVDLVLHGHAHTFEKTCPMKAHRCALANEHGVTYLTASGGGTSYLRSVTPQKSVSISLENRSFEYECSQILDDYQSGWHHFCHYAVGDCQLIVRCFDHDYWSGGKVQHQFMLNKCR